MIVKSCQSGAFQCQIPIEKIPIEKIDWFNDADLSYLYVSMITTKKTKYS